MEITFQRSGGFAGRATNVSGTVELKDATAHVSAEGTDYGRDLSAAEVTELRKLATTGVAHAKNPSASDPVRDGFQYDVVVRNEDGHKHTLHLAAPSPSQDVLPATLADWLQREAQRIWQYRMAKKSN